MKKLLACLICMLYLGMAAGCQGGASSGASGQQTGVEDAAQDGTEQAEGQSEAQAASSQTDASDETPAAGSVGAAEVDVDLTALSSTMVYSEVYNMLYAPENYIGKTVRMTGTFAVYYEESTDVYYFACLIADAAACCSQGIEFVLSGDYSYPADYPEIGEEITVSGQFDTYQEGGYTYCTLRNASLEG